MELGRVTDLGRVSFASEKRLLDRLNVLPGSVSIMGVINDPAGMVEVIIDQAVWDASHVRCHPLVNTATIVMSANGLRTMLQITGHEPTIMDIPAT